MAARILIVDDDPIQRRLLEEAIKRFGYDAVTAEGGEEALALLGAARGSFDLMVLDLVMPDLDGMGVMDAMRREGLTTPVIIQTANASLETVISAMSGATTTLPLPLATTCGPSGSGVPAKTGMASSPNDSTHPCSLRIKTSPCWMLRS